MVTRMLKFRQTPQSRHGWAVSPWPPPLQIEVQHSCAHPVPGCSMPRRQLALHRCAKRYASYVHDTMIQHDAAAARAHAVRKLDWLMIEIDVRQSDYMIVVRSHLQRVRRQRCQSRPCPSGSAPARTCRCPPSIRRCCGTSTSQSARQRMSEV